METDTSLLNKNVLLIAPAFFGYELEIQAELERRGAIVSRLLDRPFERASMKAMARFGRRWIMPAADRYYERELTRLGDLNYSLAIVISGQTVSERTISRIASENPGVRMILYMWDSLKNRPAAAQNFPLFDRVLTFDRDDAHLFGIPFRPLFYGAGFEVAETTLDRLDFSFIGTAHTDRYRVVSKIARQAPPTAKSRIFYFLHAPWVFFAQKIINPAFREAKFSEFSFTSLPKSEVWETFRRSNVIIDVEHPRQRGLTMRTIETFGAGKKLITTNADVRQYDLFNPANILVIDRAVPKVPAEFLFTPPAPVDATLRYKYSIRGWMDDILGPDRGPCGAPPDASCDDQIPRRPVHGRTPPVQLLDRT